MDGEQKQFEQDGANRAEENPRGRGRGRGRGFRGRGRGAGRGGQRDRTNLPSATQRAAQLGVPTNTSSQVGQAPPTLSALSKLIDEQYPVTAINLDNLQSFIIDPSGYFNLALATYTELSTSWRHLPEQISAHEWLLVLGWALVYRILKIRARMGYVIAEHSEFLQSMPELKLPGPIVEYINHVGLIELPDHTRVFPDLVVPCGITNIAQHPFLTGAIPNRLSAWNSHAHNALPQMTMFGHMYPFGFLERAFARHIGPPANAAHYLDRFDPANANNIDAWLARPHTLVGAGCNLPTPHANRIAGNVFANVYSGDTFVGSLRFVPDVVGSYMRVANILERYMHFGLPTDSTKGSLAQVAYASYIPRQQYGIVESVVFKTAVDLSSSELHAARTFQFRRQMHDDHCAGPNDEDVNVSLVAAPNLIRDYAPIQFTTLNTPGLYLNYIASLYVKGRVDHSM